MVIIWIYRQDLQFIFLAVFTFKGFFGIRVAPFNQTQPAMSKLCQVTQKRPIVGNNVSHANNRTKRRFNPNIHQHRFWVASENRWVRLTVSAKGMRIIDKKGIETVLADLRKLGNKI